MKNIILNFEKEGILSKEKSNKLLQGIDIIGFDYKKLSKWCFIISIFCSLISLTSLYDLIIKYNFIRMILSFFLSVVFYYLGFNKKNNKKKLLKEFFVFLGILSMKWFIGEIIMLNFLKDYYNLIFLCTFVTHILIAYFSQSNLILIFALFSFSVWFGLKIGYIPEYGSYFLGIFKSLSFIFFGIVLIIISYIINIFNIEKIKIFFKIFLSMGLLYLFMALWILSIFGHNFGQNLTSKLQLFLWSIIFGLFSIISFYIGMKHDNYILKVYGIIFLFINLYTKYFEYFWGSMNKFIFFFILALSFYIFGKKSEEVYLFLERSFKKK